MVELCLTFFNISIAAGWAIIAVILLRFLLKAIKAPGYIINILWLIVGIRLVMPFSISSPFSLVPSVNTLPVDVMQNETPVIHTGIDSFNRVVNPVVKDVAYSAQQGGMNLWQMLSIAAAIVWLVVVAVLIMHGVVRWIILNRKLKNSMRLRDNIYLYDGASNAFVFGFPAKIYVSSYVNQAQRELVILHEQTHIKRKDHWWKPIAYLLVCINWYNPLVWVAYAMLSKDIEAACDQNTVKNMTMEQKLDYSQALLDCSAMPRSVALCPIAFGEVSIKSRIKGVLKYRKPALWTVITAVLSCLVITVCFLTDPAVKAISTSSPDFIPLSELKYVPPEGENESETTDYRFDKYPRFTVPALKNVEFIKTENDLVILNDQEELEYISLINLTNGVYFRDYTRDGVVDVCYMNINQYNDDKGRVRFSVYDCVNDITYTSDIKDFTGKNVVSSMIVRQDEILLFQHNGEKYRIVELFITDEELQKDRFSRYDQGIVEFKEFLFDVYNFRYSLPGDKQYNGAKLGSLLIDSRYNSFLLITNDKQRAFGTYKINGKMYHMTDEKTGNTYVFEKYGFALLFDADSSASTAGWINVAEDHGGRLPDGAMFMNEKWG